MQREIGRRTARTIAALLALAAAANAASQSIDSFNPMPASPPTTLALQADGKLILAGNFLAIGTTPRERIARFNRDGSLDGTFQDPGVNGVIESVAVQADGKILLGGGFDVIGTAAHHDLARLNADGSLDASFVDAGLDSTVWAIAVQPDGKVLAAGDFQHVGAAAQSYLARFNANGSFDASFAAPQLCCNVARAVALQADGHVLVGGYFSHVGSDTHFYLARFSSSGAFDASFPQASNLQGNSIVVAPDGAIFVNDGGNDVVRKLSAAGAIDASFTPAAADAPIDALLLQPDGKVVISGIFQNVGGQPHHALARLNANGTLDSGFADLHLSFDAANPNGYVYGIAAQADGNIVAVGNFTLAATQARQYVARVISGDAIVDTLTAQPSGSAVVVTWTRGGGGEELAQAPLLRHSSDGVSYNDVGPMTRIAGGWQMTAPYSFAGTPFYLQAQGVASVGANNGSASRVDSPVVSNDRIFANGFE